MDSFDFINLATENSLQLIDTTSERNGYPRNLRKAIIGFDTFEQAQTLAKENGLYVEVFTKRDGWQLWARTGNKAYNAFERSADEFGDDYMMWTRNDAQAFYEQEIQAFVDEVETFEDSDDYESRMDVFEDIKQLADNQAIVTCCGDYYDTIDVKTMIYEYDTHHYAIGLIDYSEE